MLRKLSKSGNFKRKVKKNITRINNEKIDVHSPIIISKSSSDVSLEDSNVLPNLLGPSTSFGVDFLDESISQRSCADDSEDLLPSENNDLRFKSYLKEWAVRHRITHLALQDLLFILNNTTNLHLPRDPRTFLGTNKKNIEICNIAGGQYWHNGLRACINQIYDQKLTNIFDISLTINIDGLPIYNSSKFEFWPILFRINEIDTKPMIIGIYYGKGKPSNLNDFLSKFVEELLEVMKDGILIEGHKINVSLKCFICDSPARAFIKGVANFNSQHGCQKCTITGEYSYVSHTNYYPNKESSKRTDEDFRSKKDEYHHKTDSVILRLPIDMVKCFPVADSLHLIDLGVVKRLLIGWRDGTFKNKLLKWSAKTTEDLTTSMVQIKLPKELHRAIRGLDCLSFWKGLEYRNFLLYYGIAILKNNLNNDVYNHFLCLFCAITISSTDYFKSHLHVAEALLKHFVNIFCKIYGEYYVTSNIHNLTHLVEDVKMLGNLSKISAYPFESKLYEIKKMLRSGKNPLAQVARRLMEMQNTDIGSKAKDTEQVVPRLVYETTNRTLSVIDEHTIIYRRVLLREYCLGGGYENSWFLTKNNDIVYFLAAACIANNIVVCGKKISTCDSYFEIPLNSKLLNIYTSPKSIVSEVTKSNSKISEETFTLDDIKCKLVCIFNKTSFIFIPLLHTYSSI